MDASAASCRAYPAITVVPCRAADTQVQELTSAQTELASSVEQLTAEKERLMPQLEQARWQNRQLERKLEDVTTAKQSAEEV